MGITKNLIEKIGILVKDNEFHEKVSNGTSGLLEALISRDILSAFSPSIEIISATLLIPNIMFWDKMDRFLRSAYSDANVREKLLTKFRNNDHNYHEFVKKQMQLIEQIEFDEKIDVLANLTKALINESLENAEYFRLAWALKSIYYKDLLYLKKFNPPLRMDNCFELRKLHEYNLVSSQTIAIYNSGSETTFSISDSGDKMLKYGLTNTYCMSQELS